MRTRKLLALCALLTCQNSMAVDTQILEELSQRETLPGQLMSEHARCTLRVKKIVAPADRHYTLFYNFSGKKGHVEFPGNDDQYPERTYLKWTEVHPGFGLEKNFILTPPDVKKGKSTVDFAIEYRSFGDIDKESFVEGPCRVELSPVQTAPKVLI
jgi:hypothetical protein